MKEKPVVIQPPVIYYKLIKELKMNLDDLIKSQPHICDLQIKYGHIKKGITEDFPNCIPLRECSILVISADGSYKEFNVRASLVRMYDGKGMPLFVQYYVDLLLYKIWPEIFTSFDLEATGQMIEENVPENLKVVIVSTEKQVFEIIQMLNDNPTDVDNILKQAYQKFWKQEFQNRAQNEYENDALLINDFYKNYMKGL